MMVHDAPKRSQLIILTFIVKCTTLSILIKLIYLYNFNALKTFARDTKQKVWS